MDRNNMEVEVLENAVAEATDAQVRDLNDLQLAFVGGGVGEITPY